MRKVTYTTCFCAILLATCASAQETNKVTAVFNQSWLKALVSIEVIIDQQATPIGSGFIVQTPSNHIALVTAKHVVFQNNGNGPLIPGLLYRLNVKHGDSDLITDDQTTKHVKSTWIRSPSNDIACRLIVVREGTSDYKAIPYKVFLSSQQVQAGAPLFIIGFPMGLRSEKYATPIVRRGIVARNDGNNILVDGFVYPGNSGGPVIYEPSLQLGESFITPILQGDWLIGLVVSEISYIDTAVSQQTKRPRVTFEDNSGLCNVLPANLIMDLLKSQEFTKMDEEIYQ